jgi:hypothetical protein
VTLGYPGSSDQDPEAVEPGYPVQVTSWARDTEVQTEEEASAPLEDQMPFHFRDPQGVVLQEHLRRTARSARHAPDVIRHFASQAYGGSDAEDKLGEMAHPVLVLAGRHDRTGALCGIPGVSYLTGLHILITSRSSTANQVVGVMPPHVPSPWRIDPRGGC